MLPRGLDNKGTHFSGIPNLLLTWKSPVCGLVLMCWCPSCRGQNPHRETQWGFLVNYLTVGPFLTAQWAYLGREIAAEFELLQGQGHGVRPEEKDEGHECQVWDKLAGIPKQLPTIVQTFLLAQQRPVQCCEVKGVVLGDKAQERKGQGLPGKSAVSLPLESLRQPTYPSHPPWGPATELCSRRKALSRNNKLQGPWED